MSKTFIDFKRHRPDTPGSSLCVPGWNSGRWPALFPGSASGSGPGLAPFLPSVLYEMRGERMARSAWRGLGQEEKIAPESHKKRENSITVGKTILTDMWHVGVCTTSSVVYRLLIQPQINVTALMSLPLRAVKTLHMKKHMHNKQHVLSQQWTFSWLVIWKSDYFYSWCNRPLIEDILNDLTILSQLHVVCTEVKFPADSWESHDRLSHDDQQRC